MKKARRQRLFLIKPPVYWILMSGKSAFRKMTSWTKQNILRRLWSQPVLLSPVNWIAAAGSMSDMDAVRTVRARGIFMEHAAPEGTGAMAAVLGMDGEAVERTVHDLEGVFIANYNCPGQIVITGEKEAVEQSAAVL